MRKLLTVATMWAATTALTSGTTPPLSRWITDPPADPRFPRNKPNTDQDWTSMVVLCGTVFLIAACCICAMMCHNDRNPTDNNAQRFFSGAQEDLSENTMPYGVAIPVEQHPSI